MLQPDENNGGTFQEVPGNLGDFMNSIQTPHEVENESAPDFDTQDAEEPIQFSETGEDAGEQETGKQIPTGATLRLGDALAKGCNKAIPGLYSIYSHAPAEKYMISDEEVADLSQAFADYLMDVGANVSPAQALVCAIAGSFATQIPMVLSDRKAYEAEQKKDVTADGNAEDVREKGEE